MITLTIELPDDKVDGVLATVEKAGGNVVDFVNDDDLSLNEFRSLQVSYKEALQIRDGKVKAIPALELWNHKL